MAGALRGVRPLAQALRGDFPVVVVLDHGFKETTPRERVACR
jgi:hypothetical protein